MGFAVVSRLVDDVSDADVPNVLWVVPGFVSYHLFVVQLYAIKYTEFVGSSDILYS